MRSHRSEWPLSAWLRWQESLHPNAIDLGLARLNQVLQRLRWRRPECPVITVAGTNGKGSSVALLSGILNAAGYRVGAFTSPHLLRYNERIALAGVEASDASLIAAFERIDIARGAITLTFFEFNTLAALLLFETAYLDVLLLEVGLGGRLDAVNAVDCDAALVTSVALDHCDWLGADAETIGREKAGIFRPGRPAVFGARQLPQSVARVAQETGADLLHLGTDFEHHRTGRGWTWLAGARLGHRRLDDLPLPALVGNVQLDNAAAVLTLLATLEARLPVAREAIARGLTAVRLRGRFQGVTVDDVPWILDVAHNPAAAAALAAQLAAQPWAAAATHPARPPRSIAVCGMLGDKDSEGMARELRNSFDVWIVAGLTGSRAISATTLAQRLASGAARPMQTAATVAAACEQARLLAGPADRVVVFGSFLTVSGALAWLESQGLAESCPADLPIV